MESTGIAFRASSSTFLAKSPNPLSCRPRNPKPCFSFSKTATFKCLQTPNPASPLKPAPEESKTPSFLSSKTKLQFLLSEFQTLKDPMDRVRRVLDYASRCPTMDESLKVAANRVPGCTSQVWLHLTMDHERKMRFIADSDSEITKGLCACLISVLDGATAEEVLELRTDDLLGLSVAGFNGTAGTSSSRANTWHNVLVSMQKRTKALEAEREGRPRSELFPSLVISSDGIEANGSYALAQARFLSPDELKVQEIANLLKEKKIGVAAHFYMDPEVQGVLTAAQKLWPHIHISDSLVMADSAVNMAKAGCQFITVLGVDFMSENVRAILDQAGFPEVGVYRMSDETIGCTLADAASSPQYMDYLSAASSSTSPSLHVVYINTSLETKAYSHELVPTITCTSSNVVQTILQAFAEVPSLNVWYGPDSYMGGNIAELFHQMTTMTDEEIAEVHPQHNKSSMKSLLPRLHYFQDGTCIVHHLFGHEVVQKIKEMYGDAFLTAHFEVPGEMFSLAIDAQKRGMGVVGSTKSILDFIIERLQEALDRNVDDHLQFVLGTESGMVTSIVAAVRELLGSVSSSSSGRAKVSVEIIFPVSSESVTRTEPSTSTGLNLNGNLMGLSVIPGITSGEGCSIHGGCASCPYMKMNSLSSLLKVCHSLPDDKKQLAAYEAARFSLRTPNGKLIADVGCEPILHMRHFQATKRLPEKLVQQISHPEK